MDGPRDCCTEWSESDRERQISNDIAYMWNLRRNDTDELIHKTETDSQTTENDLVGKGWGKG